MALGRRSLALTPYVPNICVRTKRRPSPYTYHRGRMGRNLFPKVATALVVFVQPQFENGVDF